MIEKWVILMNFDKFVIIIFVVVFLRYRENDGFNSVFHLGTPKRPSKN